MCQGEKDVPAVRLLEVEARFAPSAVAEARLERPSAEAGRKRKRRL